MSVGWLTDWLVGWLLDRILKNYTTDFHETWMDDPEQASSTFVMGSIVSHSIWLILGAWSNIHSKTMRPRWYVHNISVYKQRKTQILMCRGPQSRRCLSKRKKWWFSITVLKLWYSLTTLSQMSSTKHDSHLLSCCPSLPTLYFCVALIMTKLVVTVDDEGRRQQAWRNF